MTDDDGRTYKTVEIAYPEPYQILGPPQIWMAENLNYNVSGSVCYDELEINCEKYGRLYNWAAAMKLEPRCNSENCAALIDAKKHRGICPANWHIPTGTEWNTLITMIGGKGSGANIKATSGWDGYNDGYNEQSGNGIDTYGFAALPGGSGTSDKDFSYVGSNGFWWGNSSGNPYMLMITKLNSNMGIIGGDGGIKSNFFSVRCIKD